MLPLEVLVVLAVAAYRLARIVTLDTISDPFREILHRWAWDDSKPVRDADGVPRARPRKNWRTWVDGLLTCPLCFGVWTAAAFYALWRWSGSTAVHAGIVVLAVAGAQCALALAVEHD